MLLPDVHTQIILPGVLPVAMRATELYSFVGTFVPAPRRRVFKVFVAAQPSADKEALLVMPSAVVLDVVGHSTHTVRAAVGRAFVKPGVDAREKQGEGKINQKSKKREF